ncbi:MAG: hypothetical protein SGILL_007755 [Bacillariaceae sp.]
MELLHSLKDEGNADCSHLKLAVQNLQAKMDADAADEGTTDSKAEGATDSKADSIPLAPEIASNALASKALKERATTKNTATSPTTKITATSPTSRASSSTSTMARVLLSAASTASTKFETDDQKMFRSRFEEVSRTSRRTQKSMAAVDTSFRAGRGTISMSFRNTNKLSEGTQVSFVSPLQQRESESPNNADAIAVDAYDFGECCRGLISLGITDTAMCSMFKKWARYSRTEDVKLFADYVLKNSTDPRYFKRRPWNQSFIDSVPFPQTAQQMALTGGLWNLDNFRFLKSLGDGSFASVLMAEIVPKKEQTEPKADCIVAKKFEFCPLRQVQQVLIDPLVMGTRLGLDAGVLVEIERLGLDADVLAEILGFYPIDAYYHKLEDKSVDNSENDWTEDDKNEVLDNSWVHMVTIMECGKGTLDDEFGFFFHRREYTRRRKR